jgi:hypothetical protein
MSKKHYYDVQAIKQRIDLILHDKAANYGDWIEYSTKEDAEKMCAELTKAGVDCYVKESIHATGCYDIIFTDVTRKIIKNNKTSNNQNNGQ